MDLDDINIKKIIASMPDESSLIKRLASQEVDKLASVLYEGLEQAAREVSQKKLKDSDAVHKVYYEAISNQLASIENDLAVKNLGGKLNMPYILEKVLS